MTNQEKYEELYEAFSQTGQLHLELENRIAVDGFGDIVDMGNYLRARQHWRLASNAYHIFMFSFKGEEINPNEIYRGNLNLA